MHLYIRHMDGANREVVAVGSNQHKRDFSEPEKSGVHDLKELVSDQLEIGTLRQLTNAIIQGFDYDRLAQNFSVEKWVMGDLKEQIAMLSHTLRIHNALRNNTAQCLAISSKLVAILTQYQVMLRSTGMLKQVDSSQLAHETTICPIPDFNGVRSQLSQCVQLARSFRTDAHFVEVQASELMEVLDDLQSGQAVSSLDQPGGVVANDKMLQSITNGVWGAYNSLPSHDFGLDPKNSTDTKALALGKQEWDDSTNSLSADVLSKLQEQVQSLCPIQFRKIVERIVFMNLMPESSSLGWHKAGSYLLDVASGLASIRINLVPFKDKPEQILGVIVHEIGHAGHDSFPVFLLKIWNDAIEQERSLDVTPYVAKVRKNKPDHFDAEDFAESFRLFCLEPDHLQSLSPLRYQAMLTICT